MFDLEATQQDSPWKFFEIFLLATVLLNPLLVGSVVFFSKDERFLDMTAVQQMSCLAAAIIYSLFGWIMRLSCARFPVMHTNRVRDAIFVPVMLWLVVLAYIIMPRGDFSESQRVLVSLWGFAPFGILIGWIWAFIASARKKACVAEVSLGI